MDIITIVFVSMVIGGCFAPIIAFRMKRGLNPLDEENSTISELPYKYFLYFQLVVCFTVWPSLLISLYGAALFLEHNYIKAVLCIVIALIMVSLCVALLKKLKMEYKQL